MGIAPLPYFPLPLSPHQRSQASQTTFQSCPQCHTRCKPSYSSPSRDVQWSQPTTRQIQTSETQRSPRPLLLCCFTLARLLQFSIGARFALFEIIDILALAGVFHSYCPVRVLYLHVFHGVPFPRVLAPHSPTSEHPIDHVDEVDLAL